MLVANSPRFPLPPRVSKRRAPSEPASPFAQPGGHKPQGWSLWSPLCPAADCRAKPYFQTGSWVQEPRPLHPMLWLTSQHVGSSPQHSLPGGRTQQAGAERLTLLWRMQRLCIFLSIPRMKPPSELLQLRWGAHTAAPPLSLVGSQPGVAPREHELSL